MNARKKAKHVPAAALTAKSSDQSRTFVFALLLITLITFLPVLRNDFINLDDPQYVSMNPVVQELSSKNIKLLCTEAFVGNYQPLTMLSYLFEYHFFGSGAGAFHFFSLLFHLLNTLLVFYIFKKVSGNHLIAFITAILFGIHPLHVESVAWVSARKDVLYTLYFLLSLYFYLRNTETGEKKHYLLSLLFFVLSLLSKAQAVILPVTFFLFDYLAQRKLNLKSVMQKAPFFVFAFIFGLLAVIIQKKSGAVQDYSYFPVYERILFSCYGLANYFYKTILPIKLSCFYPYPETSDKINSNWVYISPLLLIAIAYGVFRSLQNSKIIFFGMAFFMVTILLVLQLIPVGDAVMADRYTYLSSIGLFFIVGHYYHQFLEKRKQQRNLILGLGSLCILVLTVISFQRTQQWKNSITLYDDALKHYPAAIIYNNRGVAHIDKKMYKEALQDFTNTVELKARFPNGYKNRALTYGLLNDDANALKDFNTAANYFPNEESIYFQRAKLLVKTGNASAALNDFDKAISLNPANIDSYFSRAQVRSQLGMNEKALEDMNKVISMQPNLSEGYGNRGIVYGLMGKPEEAIKDFNKALELKPSAVGTYMNRSLAYNTLGNFAAALQDALTAKQNGSPVDENYIKDLESKSKKNN